MADREWCGTGGLADKARAMKRALGLGGEIDNSPVERAMVQLAERAAREMKSLTDQLLELNGLKGEAALEVLGRVQQDHSVDEGVSEGGAAAVGAVLSGAVSGLVADMVSGGLTLGGGMLAGAILGGLEFAAAAKGYNLLSGKDGTVVRWNHDSIERFLVDAVLLYLAIAHFGRGRGEWSKSEHPEHWRSVVRQVIGKDSTDLPKIDSGDPTADFSKLEAEFRECAGWAIERVLGSLYPETRLRAFGTLDGSAAGARSSRTAA